jgi:hypothetical protein
VAAQAAAFPIPIEGKTKSRWKIVPKDGLELLAFDSEAQAKAATAFIFHPLTVDGTGGDLTKNLKKKTVIPDSVSHKYPAQDELHRTSGEAVHSLEIADLEGGGIKVPVLRDFVTASISPGRNEPEKVRIEARLQDPLVFSDLSSSAQFAFVSAGLNLPLSLLAGTAFPELFAPDPFSYGAVASDTFMTVRMRVLPGVESDPAVFWSDGLPGAVDLFTLTLISDSSHNVDAQLTPGAGSSDFLLDFVGLGSAESAIESAFQGTGGRLLTDLNDFFTAGFTPAGSVSEFTVGFERMLQLGANEVPVPVPEPATLALLGLGLVLMLATRLRRVGESGRKRV